MKAIVVYESHWGNTAAIAKAIAEGLGLEAKALTTAQATAVAIAGAELVVAGAPLMGFTLPTEAMLKNLAANHGKDKAAPRRRSSAGSTAPDSAPSPSLSASSSRESMVPCATERSSARRPGAPRSTGR